MSPISRPRHSRAAQRPVSRRVERKVGPPVDLIDQSTGKLGEPNRYPVGNGDANWVEIIDVQ